MKILNAAPPYTLFGIEEQDYDKAKVVAIPIPYDSTVTNRVGARYGPHAIIDASRTVEFYNEELDRDVSKIGIYTTEELAPDFSSPQNMVKRIQKEVELVLEGKKIPLLIGGEHTISLGGINAVAKANKNFSVLQFDAHSDTRDEYFGSKYCHACVMARAGEVCSSCYGVGIRSINEEGAKRYGKQILFMKDINKMSTKQIADSIIKNTREGIYLTIDLDVLDSSEMPSTGTPEPGGMRFAQLTEVLKEVLKQKKVLGLDFVELAPTPGMHAPDYLAAKLIYLTLGYAFE